MALSIYDLVYTYLDLFYKKEKLKGQDKKTIHKEVKQLLVNGWCEDEIISAWKEFKRKNPRKRTLKASILLKGKRKKKENILKPNTFYYHNNLRLTSAPPKRKFDYDSGEIVTINEPYFLEMKSTYIVEDIVRYYAKQCRISLRKDEIKRYVGSFKWLLNTYDVDTVLFMIDAMVNHCVSEDMPFPQSPLDIQRFYREAMETYHAKKTEAVIAGGNKVVRKKRMR